MQCKPPHRPGPFRPAVSGPTCQLHITQMPTHTQRGTHTQVHTHPQRGTHRHTHTGAHTHGCARPPQASHTILPQPLSPRLPVQAALLPPPAAPPPAPCSLPSLRSGAPPAQSGIPLVSGPHEPRKGFTNTSWPPQCSVQADFFSPKKTQMNKSMRK